MCMNIHIDSVPQMFFSHHESFPYFTVLHTECHKSVLSSLLSWLIAALPPPLLPHWHKMFHPFTHLSIHLLSLCRQGETYTSVILHLCEEMIIYHFYWHSHHGNWHQGWSGSFWGSFTQIHLSSCCPCKTVQYFTDRLSCYFTVWVILQRSSLNYNIILHILASLFLAKFLQPIINKIHRGYQCCAFISEWLHQKSY